MSTFCLTGGLRLKRLVARLAPVQMLRNAWNYDVPEVGPAAGAREPR